MVRESLSVLFFPFLLSVTVFNSTVSFSEDFFSEDFFFWVFFFWVFFFEDFFFLLLFFAVVFLLFGEPAVLSAEVVTVGPVNLFTTAWTAARIRNRNPIRISIMAIISRIRWICLLRLLRALFFFASLIPLIRFLSCTWQDCQTCLFAFYILLWHKTTVHL